MAGFENIRVVVDRSSVSMGDDVDPHTEFWEFPAAATVDDLLIAISTRLLPSVAGPAGWCIYRDIRDLSRRRVLGLIYTRDDVGDEDRICRFAGGGAQTLGELAHESELAVDAIYLSGDAARPVTLSEVIAGPSSTGTRPTVLGSAAREQALIDWRAVSENRRVAAAVRDTRRAWIREHLLGSAPPPAGAALFVAESFGYLTTLLCPASMRIAGELLGLGELRSGIQAVQRTGRPDTATLAMVLGAFEWGVESEDARPAERGCSRAYFEFLAGCGYELSETERTVFGRAGSEELTTRQARIRELRNAEYHLGRNHEHGLITHEQYVTLLDPVVAELRRLGEVPEPRRPCCQ